MTDTYWSWLMGTGNRRGRAVLGQSVVPSNTGVSQVDLRVLSMVQVSFIFLQWSLPHLWWCTAGRGSSERPANLLQDQVLPWISAVLPRCCTPKSFYPTDLRLWSLLQHWGNLKVFLSLSHPLSPSIYLCNLLAVV